MEIDKTLVQSLQRGAAVGIRPSRLAQQIAQYVGVLQHEARLYVIAYFREAFQLSLADAMRIGSWNKFPDGTRTDDEIDSDLMDALARTRHLWTRNIE